MLKRRSAARPDWQRVLEKRFSCKAFDTPAFQGHVSRLEILKVREPLWVNGLGLTYCVTDDGYSWTQYFPTGKPYTITRMADGHGRVVQWYCDVCKKHALDEKGIPYWDDLFLDVIHVPEAGTDIIDAHELEQALSQGIIDKSEFDFAWKVARDLEEAITVNQLVEQLPLTPFS